MNTKDMDIKDIAKQLIYQSPTIKYIEPDKIEKAFENIHFIPDEKEFQQKFYEATRSIF